MCPTLRQLLRLGDHSSCWPARRRSTGEHGGTDASPRHVRFRDVLTALLPPARRTPQEHRWWPLTSSARDRKGARTVVNRTEGPCGSSRIHEQTPGGRGPRRLTSPFPSREEGPRGLPQAFPLRHRSPRPGGSPSRPHTGPRRLRSRGTETALERPFHRAPRHIHTLRGLLVSLRQEGGGVSSPA